MANILTVGADKFQASILMDKLPELSLSQIRKIYTLMFQFAHENQEAIRNMENYVNEAVPAAQNALKLAAREYQSGFIYTGCVEDKKDAKKARAVNRKLSKAVKSAKRCYERWLKIQSVWNKTKQKYT